MKKLISLIDTMVEEVVGKKEIEKIQKTTLKNSGILECEMIQTDIATLDLEQVNQLLKEIEAKKVFLMQKRKSMLTKLILENKKEVLSRIKKDQNAQKIINFYSSVLNKAHDFQFDIYKKELNEFYEIRSEGEKIIITELLTEVFYQVADEPLMKFSEKICTCESINNVLGESDKIFELFSEASGNIKQKEIS